MTAPARTLPDRVVAEQLRRRSGAAGFHTPAKSGRGTVRRAAISSALDDLLAELADEVLDSDGAELRDLGLVVRGVRF